MNNIKKQARLLALGLTKTLAILVTLLAFAACTEDDLPIETVNNVVTTDGKEYAYTLHFDCPPPTYEEDGQTRATETTWADGSVVYLRFYYGGSYYQGRAVYSAYTGDWTLYSNSSLSTTSGTTTRSCEAYYFENPGTVGSSSITLYATTAIYTATDATYSHPSSSEYYVKATLKPATWRLRFKSTTAQTFSLPGGSSKRGISFASSFNRSTGVITWANTTDVSLSTNSSTGYSSYVYGKFDNTSGSNLITLQYSNSESYSRSIASSRLATGESGYFTLPTSSNYSSSGWTRSYEEYLSPSYWTSTNKANNSTGSKNWSITAKSGDVLSFNYSISSESGYDKFYAKLSGALGYTIVNGVSGSYTNQTASYTFTKDGTYTLNMSYAKDGSGSSGSDQVSVTNLKIIRNSSSGGQSSGGKAGESFTVTVNGVSFDMIGVTGGTFRMGSTDSDADSDESPVHNVTLSSFSIGKTEVTQALWYAVMGQKPTSSGSKWSSTYGLGDNRPAYYVSWNDCQEFISKLNQLTGKQFRLPTEAEWEFAARGGTKSNGYKYAGSNTISYVAWYTSNSSSTTHDVATKQANELGIYDMSGNVWEWCSDWNGSYSSTAQTNPTGPTTGSSRVYRGGSWYSVVRNCRVSLRGYIEPDSRYNSLGLRLAL